MGIVDIESDGAASSENSIEADIAANMQLANGSVSIDQSASRVGIGTRSPGYELDIRSSSPEIELLDETSNSTAHIQYDGRELVFEGFDGQQDIVRIEDMAPETSLYIATDGDIGLGTESPATRLHVMGAATVEGDLAVLSSRKAKHQFEAVAPLPPPTQRKTL